MTDLPDLTCLKLSEADTRNNYIDKMLIEQGWIIGGDCLIEEHVTGIPSPSGEGFCDYVLYDREHRAIGVIEAKRTSIDPEKGYIQAKEYADVLQQKDPEHRRPVIFLSNGIRVMIEDDEPLREISGFYSQEDLQLYFNLKRTKSPSLSSAEPNPDIAGRDYQIAAIKAVCNEFSSGRRKSLLVMATGSGKTRVAASIMDILINYGWAKNVLFLADRNKLVSQAGDRFLESIPSTTITLADGKHPNPDYNARIFVTTYPSMITILNRLDRDGHRIFSPGHFQLVVIDEAHRSIYNKFGALLHYFDSRLLGLTATPRDEVDYDTFDMFDITDKTPAYDYEFYDGVEAGWLINFKLHDIDLKFFREGVRFEELPIAEQDLYRKELADENGLVPEFVPPRAFMNKVISVDSIRKVLDILWKTGLRVDGGTRLGKTIIFASSHTHAEIIRKEFYKMLPGEDKECCVIIDYKEDDKNGSLMKKFEDPDSKTRIAISVDMLDTGVDIPCILNLVFFKPVYSYVKFWQMIGRGTRPCKGIIDGEDKKEFYIFDACGNFSWFEENPGGVDGMTQMSVTESVFDLRVKLAQTLQSGDYQSESYQQFRKSLIEKIVFDIHHINLQNYDIGGDRFFIDKFWDASRFDSMSDTDVEELLENVAPHIMADEGSVNHVRFDNLMFSITYLRLNGKEPKLQYIDLMHKANELYTKCAGLGQVKPHLPMIKNLLDVDYIKGCGIVEYEDVRTSLRKLTDLLERKGKLYLTNISDVVRGIDVSDFEPPQDLFTNYKKNARKLIEANMDSVSIRKIRSNIPLNEGDFNELKLILWSQAGTEEDYHDYFENMPLDLLVRSIVGLDEDVAKAIFAKYLSSSNLSKEQTYFVNEVVKHVIRNGVLDKRKLSSKPFSSMGAISDIFDKDRNTLSDIISLIDTINANAGYDGLSDIIAA